MCPMCLCGYDTGYSFLAKTQRRGDAMHYRNKDYNYVSLCVPMWPMCLCGYDTGYSFLAKTQRRKDAMHYRNKDYNYVSLCA